MMSEEDIKKEYEMYKRLRVKHPNDTYWTGCVMALRDILEIAPGDM